MSVNLWRLSILGWALAAFCCSPTAIKAATVDLNSIDFRNVAWKATGADVLGTSWEAPLTFTSFERVGDDYSLEGIFEWTGSDGQIGNERFTGTLFADSTVQLTGTVVEEPSPGVPTSGVVPAFYLGTLTREDNTGVLVINGEFNGQGVANGIFTAVAPEPSTFLMAALALASLALVARRR